MTDEWRAEAVWPGARSDTAVGAGPVRPFAERADHGPGRPRAAPAAPPESMRLARARRAFIRRVVGFLAVDRGIRRFVEVGTRPGIAAAVQAAARAHHPEATAVHVGAESVDSVLRGGAVDPGAPTALLLLDPGARDAAAVAALVRAAHESMAPGGHVAIVRPGTGPGAAESAARLFAPFTILDPGLADMAWWPYPDDEVAAAGVGMLAGVAGPARTG